MKFPSFEEVVSNNSYARKRFTASQDYLLVGLWGFFEKAAAGLTQLYKDKLDSCLDSQCLVDTLHRIDSFYRISQEILNCAQKQGSDLGFDCQRLVLRDLFLPAEDEEIAYLDISEVYSSVLRPYLGFDVEDLLGRHRKRYRHRSHHHRKEKQGGRSHCRRCCHRHGKARRPPVKRCRLYNDGENIQEVKKVVNEGYDFSRASTDISSYGIINFSTFSSPFTHKAEFGNEGIGHRAQNCSPACAFISPWFPSATVTKLLQEAGVVLSSCEQHYDDVINCHDNLLLSPPLLPSSRKRLFEPISLCNDISTDPAFVDAVDLSSLINPLSRFSLDTSLPPAPKRHRLDSSTCKSDFQEPPSKNL